MSVRAISSLYRIACMSYMWIAEYSEQAHTQYKVIRINAMQYEVTAQRLRFALDRAGLKAQDLANRSGIGKSSISQYLSGSHAPSNKSAGAMAEVLSVNPVWLMGFDVPMVAPLTHEITAEDRAILDAYHSADAGTQQAIKKLLDLARLTNTRIR